MGIKKLPYLSTMTTYSLFQLNTYVKQVLALNFEQPVWITAELAQVGESRRSFYCELVEKDGDTDSILAQAGAVLWAPNYYRLVEEYGVEVVDALLEAGLKVRLSVQVTFHERYGLKLSIVDLDTAFTFGNLELQRRKNLEILQNQRLIDKNKLLSLTPVIQHIAVITSPTAAGWQDFKEQLTHNPYGYRYSLQVFESVVQGDRVKVEIPQQFAAIDAATTEFDAVVIVRGGGAKLDLRGFDELAVAKAIAYSPIPVICGIGHETDQSLADFVAHTSVKTPTAVADFLIERTALYEARLLERGQEIQNESRRLAQHHDNRLQQLSIQLHQESKRFLERADQRLLELRQQFLAHSTQLINQQQQKLEHYDQLVEALQPSKVLARGYSVTLVDGKSPQNEPPKAGQRLTTTTQHFTIESTVND